MGSCGAGRVAVSFPRAPFGSAGSNGSFFLIGLLSDAKKESLTEEGWAVIRSQPKAQCTKRKSPNEAAHEEKERNQLNQLNTPKPATMGQRGR